MALKVKKSIPVDFMIYALMQRTDGCLDVPCLLVQPHHSIHCSYKRHTNRFLSQHMIFQYCDKDSGEPVQMYRLARAFSA